MNGCLIFPLSINSRLPDDVTVLFCTWECTIQFCYFSGAVFFLYWNFTTQYSWTHRAPICYVMPIRSHLWCIISNSIGSVGLEQLCMSLWKEFGGLGCGAGLNVSFWDQRGLEFLKMAKVVLQKSAEFRHLSVSSRVPKIWQFFQYAALNNWSSA